MLEGFGQICGRIVPLLSIGTKLLARPQSLGAIALLLLPLSADGRMVDMILGGIAVEPMSASPPDPGATERYTLE